MVGSPMRIATLFALLLALAVPASTAAGPPPDAEPCAAGEVERVVARFVFAFNARRLVALDRVFASEPGFEWYSTGAPGARVGPAAYERSTLMPYFRARQRQGERLRLVRLRGNGNANGYGHFQFLLERRTRTLPPRVYEGKGAAICAAGGDTIAVWSVGARLVR
jgi:hypothetical protein